MLADLKKKLGHNKANEVTSITGGSWVVPAHDEAGNVTLEFWGQIPK